ncbi:hypothetical protein AAG906_016707 [Vitis piasezkii]
MDLENSIYGYLHEGGRLYLRRINKYNTRLGDDEDMHMMLSHSYDYARIYVLKRTQEFQYKFKKNSPKRISVCCLVDGCPWRITANSVGTTKILKVNIFIDVHNHCADVECSSQPSMRGRRGARVIEQVIRATSICPSNLQRLRVAYDADDGMFPIAFGVVSSENYEDWLWFLQKLKGILQDKEFAHLACDHMGSRKLESAIGPKIEEKLLENIIKIDIFGHFNSIPNHNMPIVDDDGCVRDAQGRLYPSLKPPSSKRPLEGLDTVE